MFLVVSNSHDDWRLPDEQESPTSFPFTQSLRMWEFELA